MTGIFVHNYLVCINSNNKSKKLLPTSITYTFLANTDIKTHDHFIYVFRHRYRLSCKLT